MTEYQWIYVNSGIKKKRVKIFLHIGIKAVYQHDDIAIACMHEKKLIEKGNTFKNSINDFMLDCKHNVEASLAGKSYTYKETRMSQTDYNRFLKGE